MTKAHNRIYKLHKNSYNSYYALLVIIIIGLVLSLYMYSGPYALFDDTTYISFANQILNNRFNIGQSIFAYGYLLPLTIAGSFKLFGISIFAAIIPSIVEYVLLVILTFMMGRLLFKDDIPAILASFIVSIMPSVVGYVTRTMPDMLTALIVSASFYFFIRSIESGWKGNPVLAGAFAGLAIYVKMEALSYILFSFISLVIFVVAPKFRIGLKRSKMYRSAIRPSMIAVYALIGFAVVMFIYLIPFALLKGNLLYPFVYYNEYSYSPTTAMANLQNLNVIANPLYVVSSHGNGALAADTTWWRQPIGIALLLCAMGTALSIIKRDRVLPLLSIITWGVFLWFFFGTVSLHEYQPAITQTRFLLVVSPFIALLAAFALFEIYKSARNSSGKATAYLLLFGLLFLLVASNVPSYGALYNYNHNVIYKYTESLKKALRYTGNDSRIYTNDGMTSTFVSFLLKFRNPSIGIVLHGTCNPSNSYMLIVGPSETYNGKNISPWLNGTCDTDLVANLTYDSTYMNLYRLLPVNKTGQ